MSSAGNPEESLQEPVCPVCKGTRFVHPLLPSGKPDVSQVVPCSCTRKESEEDRAAHLLRYSNLGMLTRYTFATLNPVGNTSNPANQKAYKSAYEAALAFAEQPSGWMVFTGPSGCGKTHLAAAIANQCIEKRRPVFYMTTPDLLDHLRSSFSPTSEVPYDEFFEQVRNAPVLILDDLGAQSTTPWAKEKLEQLLSHRYGNELPTVIISIVPIDELDERIITRIANSKVFQVCSFGDDLSSSFTYEWAPQFRKQKEMTFENFDWKRRNLPPEQRENLDRAYQLAYEFARSPEGWLVFQGENGCGKTHLAAAVVNHRYQNGQPALFIVVPDFLDHLRSSFSPESKVSYDQYFESVKNAPLLIFDDFGKQTTSPWAREKLYQVVNYRYNAQLPTMITTNCTADELDSAILSRFTDPQLSMLFTITAPDYWAGRSNVKPSSRSTRRNR